MFSISTYIRDGMALVQCMDAKKHSTFGDLATDYCRQLTSCFAKAHTVADVFDRYDVKNSIKSAERERRTKVRQSKTSWSETTFTISGFPNEPAM
jgi:hypothetical protein